MSRYRFVFFDMDGTLIDSIPTVTESFQQALEAVYGKRETDSEKLKNTIGLPLEQSFASYPAEDFPALKEAYIAINDRLSLEVPLFCGVRDMLNTLKECGVTLAVVTSKRTAPTLAYLERQKLMPLFSLVVTKEMTTRHKPNGEPVVYAMKHVGAGISSTLYVGDSRHDVLCAQDAGVASAVVDWTRMEKEPLRMLSPTHWIKTPKELCTLCL